MRMAPNMNFGAPLGAAASTTTPAPMGGIPGNPGFPGVPPIRDLGTGAPPFDPNNPRAVGIPPGGPLFPRDIGTGAPPFNPNNPRAVGIFPGGPMIDSTVADSFPTAGFPPRDLGTGAPPFDPNNPRAGGGILGALSALFGNINGIRPPNQQPPQVGPFGGFSGDPKPAPGTMGAPMITNIPRGPVTPPTGPMVPVRGGGMAPASIAPMMKNPMLGGLASLLRGRR